MFRVLNFELYLVNRLKIQFQFLKRKKIEYELTVNDVANDLP